MTAIGVRMAPSCFQETIVGMLALGWACDSRCEIWIAKNYRVDIRVECSKVYILNGRLRGMGALITILETD